jgi:hypothetical protein
MGGYTHAAVWSGTFSTWDHFRDPGGHRLLPVGLAFFGVFVGLVNMSDVDSTNFLITGIALEVSASAFRQFAFIGAAMSDVMIFVGGAVLVVAMRTLFRAALSQLWRTHK